ncbi:MAG: hypothetical protein II075_04940 [Bacteroidales bacterium]|nr:hypothetical protein [Bacteroidales bacterium]
MKQLLTIIILLLTAATSADAQMVNNVRRVTDSVIATFGNAVEGKPYTRTELIKEPTNYYMDESGDLTGDSVWVANYEDFKFYRTRTDGRYTVAEYFVGKNANIFEAEKIYYYYDDKRLVMTDYNYVRHGEAIDDFGVSMFIEQKRVLFEAGGKPLNFPLMLFREGEGISENLNMDEIPFRQIDIRKIIYDKNIYELIAHKIISGEEFEN